MDNTSNNKVERVSLRQLPLQLSYSTGKHHSSKHYERFLPVTLAIKGNKHMISNTSATQPKYKTKGFSVHSHGFTPWVYSRSNDDDYKAGYRKRANVIGLTSIGYVDIDAVKTTNSGLKQLAEQKLTYLLPLTKGLTGNTYPMTLTHGDYLIPTIENVTEALRGSRLWCYVHSSASRSEGKLRVLYRRNLMAYAGNSLDTVTYDWSLEPVSSQAETHIVVEQVEGVISQALPIDILSFTENLVREEHKVIVTLLEAAGINFTGIDMSAIMPHMHSSHLTTPTDNILPSEIITGEPICVVKQEVVR